jgi:hypothetical protein
MTGLLPSRRSLRNWQGALLGPSPFRGDTPGALAAFFKPARRLCSRPVPAEKTLASSIPARLRPGLALSLRFWQVSQEITLAHIRRGRLLPGMDMPMTLNFAMALGNYSRHFLFSSTNIPAAAAPGLHAAFAREMTAMPAAMALRRHGSAGKAFTPAASAARLAAAFNAAFPGRRA